MKIEMGQVQNMNASTYKMHRTMLCRKVMVELGLGAVLLHCAFELVQDLESVQPLLAFTDATKAV